MDAKKNTKEQQVKWLRALLRLAGPSKKPGDIHRMPIDEILAALDLPDEHSLDAVAEQLSTMVVQLDGVTPGAVGWGVPVSSFRIGKDDVRFCFTWLPWTPNGEPSDRC